MFPAILGVMLAASIYLFFRSHMFAVAQVTVEAEPQYLFADGISNCRIQVRSLNKLGFDVPFTSNRLRCFFEEGAELAVLSYNADSTTAVLRSGVKSGDVVLRIISDAGPYPMLLRVELRALIARAEYDAPVSAVADEN
jgi:hypothetical protein